MPPILKRIQESLSPGNQRDSGTGEWSREDRREDIYGRFFAADSSLMHSRSLTHRRPTVVRFRNHHASNCFSRNVVSSLLSHIFMFVQLAKLQPAIPALLGSCLQPGRNPLQRHRSFPAQPSGQTRFHRIGFRPVRQMLLRPPCFDKPGGNDVLLQLTTAS